MNVKDQEKDQQRDGQLDCIEDLKRLSVTIAWAGYCPKSITHISL